MTAAEALSRDGKKIAVVALACSLALMGAVVAGMPVAHAAATTISPITRVPGTDAATGVGFAWHTASSSAPQPDTRLLLGPADGFDCAQADWRAAPAPTVTDDDRVRYSQATVTGLTPGADYSYCVRSLDGADVSPTGTFTMPSAAPDETTVLAFADANWRSTASYQNNFAGTVRQALQQHPGASLATHNGATGSSIDASHWDGFTAHTVTASDQLAWPITWVPTALAAGASNRFFALGNALPATGADTNNYAVRHGDLLLLVINSYLTSTAAQTATLDWIAAQVNALGADRAHTWVVASIPTQLYAATTASTAYANALKRAFRSNGVALVLQGGAKAYTRSWPIGGDAGDTVWRDYPSRSAIATSDGVIYLNPGASGVEQAGVPAAAISASNGWLSAATGTLTSAQQTAAADKSYSVITATADDLRVVAQTAGGQQLDTFVINRGVTPAYEVRDLDSLGLTNSFGVDAATTRTFTWLAPTSVGYTSPYIKLATGADSLANAPARSEGCSASRLASSMSNYTAYTCQVTGLNPGTMYSYQMGAHIGLRLYESTPQTFDTEAETDADGFTFLDFADSQSSPVSTYATYWGNTLSTALAQHPEAKLAIQNGDITETPDESNITAWLDATAGSLGRVAFNPVMGNHDSADAAQPMWNGIFPRQSITAPPAYSSPAALEYAQVYGNALFLYLNTNLTTAAQLKQTSQWVLDTVAAYGTNPDGTDRFVIVVEHKSPFGGIHSGAGAYPTGDYGNPAIVAELPKAFDEAGVDLVLAGHDHNLIRSLPIQWSSEEGKAVWDRADATLGTINSDSDGLVYYIPRNSGEKTYPLISAPSATSRPWIGWYWPLDTDYDSPDSTVYSVVNVTKTEIHVDSYRTGDPTTPVDSFTIVQGASVSLPGISVGNVVLAGTQYVGSKLTMYVSAVTPADASVSFQWWRDGQPIAGATGASYVMTAADIAAHLDVRVTLQATGHLDTQVTMPVLKVGSVGRLRVRGAAVVGETLTATSGGMTSLQDFRTLAYEWRRVRAATREPIPGANAATYQVTADDAGSQLQVCVSDVAYPKPVACSPVTQAVVE